MEYPDKQAFQQVLNALRPRVVRIDVDTFRNPLW